MHTKFSTILPAGTYLLGDYTPIAAVLGDSMPFPEEGYGIDGVMANPFHMAFGDDDNKLTTAFGTFVTGGTLCLVPVGLGRTVEIPAFAEGELSFVSVELGDATPVTVAGDDPVNGFSSACYLSIGDTLIDMRSGTRVESDEDEDEDDTESVDNNPADGVPAGLG